MVVEFCIYDGGKPRGSATRDEGAISRKVGYATAGTLPNKSRKFVRILDWGGDTNSACNVEVRVTEFVGEEL